MRAHTSRHLTALALALVFGVAGCASGGGGGSSSAPGSNSNRIVKAELDELGNVDGLEAIERQWSTLYGEIGACRSGAALGAAPGTGAAPAKAGAATRIQKATSSRSQK